jgi:hypothetical protein
MIAVSVIASYKIQNINFVIKLNLFTLSTTPPQFVSNKLHNTQFCCSHMFWPQTTVILKCLVYTWKHAIYYVNCHLEIVNYIHVVWLQN